MPHKGLTRAGFTMLELIAAVSILSIGIVLILQSRLRVIEVFDSASLQIKALQFLEEKATAIEQGLREVGGIESQDSQEDITLGSRKGSWTVATTPIEFPKEEEEPGEEEEKEDELYEVTSRLTWGEENKDKDILWVMYWPAITVNAVE